jgi:hypothetical protein
MRESRKYGSVRGALSNERPYRDHRAKPVRSSRYKSDLKVKEWRPLGSEC